MPPGPYAPPPYGAYGPPQPQPYPPVSAYAWAPDPGMPPEYARAVWTALAYEHEPHRLRAFGDRMHEMAWHRSGSALHGRADALEHHHYGGMHGGGGGPHYGYGGAHPHF
jgi:hypothetical protein